jgi:ankyrin repeat protein
MQKFLDQRLQKALLQAAKVGHIKLMRELINTGANPFICDDDGRNAISYAMQHDPDSTFALVSELSHMKDEDTA